MNNWQGKSDFEINVAVTSFIHECENWELNNNELYHCGIDGDGHFSQPILDYCNDEGLAMPIIKSNLDELSWRCPPEYCSHLLNKVEVTSEFRITMICFLEMNGVKP